MLVPILIIGWSIGVVGGVGLLSIFVYRSDGRDGLRKVLKSAVVPVLISTAVLVVVLILL